MKSRWRLWRRIRNIVCDAVGDMYFIETRDYFMKIAERLEKELEISCISFNIVVEYGISILNPAGGKNIYE